MCSWQKPHCEKNHEYIRKICPKGTSFDDYSQKDINHFNKKPEFCFCVYIISYNILDSQGAEALVSEENTVTFPEYVDCRIFHITNIQVQD